MKPIFESQLVFGVSPIANEQIYADILSKIFLLFQKNTIFGIRMIPGFNLKLPCIKSSKTFLNWLNRAVQGKETI